ncbi:acetate--CoA ligase family protein [[Eubacterium] cellulosolvens]
MTKQSTKSPKSTRRSSKRSRKCSLDDIDSKQLNCLFSPKSIAVVGTSRRKGSIGREILHNLVEYGFQGPVYPVNPKADFIHSMKAYPSISAIPGRLDLAIIVVPKKYVLNTVKECGKKGVRGIVVISAGFKEIGEKGQKLEKKLVKVVRSYGMRMVGPNCMGIINTDPKIKMDGTFAPAHPIRGRVGFLSQSGALGNIILDYASELNIGFSKFVSLGNKADISANDILEDLENDKNTDIILMYLESFGNPRKFTKIVRRLSQRKPIIAVKAGRTLAGARAASSHTGALAGMDVAVDALFEQCGVHRATSIDELFDYALAFANQPLPAGNRVAILSNAGGPAIIATDACVSLGLEITNFDPKTSKKLREKLPEEASIKNPIDILGDGGPERYKFALETIIKDPNVDAVITIFVPPLVTNPLDIAKAITEVSSKHLKPVLGCFMGREDILAGVEELEVHNVPAYLFPESAAKALAGMHKYMQWRKKELGKLRKFKVKSDLVARILESVRLHKRTQLTGYEVERVLCAYGFPYPKSGLAKSEAEAVKIAKKIGYPVVLKIASSKILHKSDVGGVIIDIRNSKELKEGYNKIMTSLRKHDKVKEIDGVQVQELLKGGKEAILGVTHDPSFGPLIMFGLGGIYVEVLKDVSFRIHPLTDVDAKEMVRSIQGYKLLRGIRGEEPVDTDLIEENLLRLSQLITDFPEIEQLDINPLLVFEKGKSCCVVDAKIILKK